MPDTKRKATEKNKEGVRRPLRMCCACRTRHEKHELFRIVRLPDGALSPDEGKTGSGRGVYVCRSINCIASARKRRAAERALGADSDPALYIKLEELLGTG